MTVPANTNELLLRSAAPATYQVSRSLRFNSADSAYLSRTPASAGNRKTWTWAGWYKVSGKSSNQFARIFGASDTYLIHAGSGGSATEYSFYWNLRGGGTNYVGEFANLFRDPSAWLHIVWAVDTTQATASNRSKLYINGVQLTAAGPLGISYCPQNDDLSVNNTVQHYISSTSGYVDGYLADIWFLDGIAATPSDFAETDATTGQWIPKAYTGSKGTNGFHLEFADNSNNTATTLGKDTANSNNWTPNNFSVTAGAGNDSLVDTPSSYGTDDGLGGSVRGNYTTLNPLQSSATLSNGNLDCSTTSTSWQASVGTIFQSTGKWYAEFTITSNSGGGIHIGIVGPNYSVATGNYIGNTATSYAYRADGSKFSNATNINYGASYTTNDVIGVAMDLDAGTLVFYKNGTSQGTAYTGMTGEKAFAVSVGSTTGTHAVSCNFGQRAWAYTPPANHRPLVDTLLPSPSVAKPSTVMDVKLYTGNGSTQTVSGLSFSPDLIWIKSRSAAYDHQLGDTVRGVGNILHSNLTAAESALNTITATTASGFTVDATSYVGTNANGQTFAAWAWDAGSSTVTNTQGSITSQVRANASAGFSIVTYTGTGSAGTVGHGCGTAPSLIIAKNRDRSIYWPVYHASAGKDNFLRLNTTDAQVATNVWNNTTPTSTVFSIGADNSVYPSGEKIVAYCFAPVSGYSSFGSYTGNGSADGPFVFCGFRPRWLLVKSVNYADTWVLIDAARETYNVMNTQLRPNSSNAESVAVNDAFDFLSNGFKVRGGGAVVNTSAAPFIYCAFAESPFQYARAR